MVVALLLPESAEQVTVESALMASMWPAPVQSLACTPPLEEAAGLGRRAEASVPLEMLAALVVSLVAEAAKATPLVLVVVVAQAPAEVTVSPVSAGICEQAAAPARSANPGCAWVNAPCAFMAVTNWWARAVAGCARVALASGTLMVRVAAAAMLERSSCACLLGVAGSAKTKFAPALAVVTAPSEVRLAMPAKAPALLYCSCEVEPPGVPPPHRPPLSTKLPLESQRAQLPEAIAPPAVATLLVLPEREVSRSPAPLISTPPAKAPTPRPLMAHARLGVLATELLSAAHCRAALHQGTLVPPCCRLLLSRTGWRGLLTMLNTLGAAGFTAKLVPWKFSAPPPMMRTTGCARFSAPSDPPTMLKALTLRRVRSLR